MKGFARVLFILNEYPSPCWTQSAKTDVILDVSNLSDA